MDSSVCYHPLNSRTTHNDNTFTIFDQQMKEILIIMMTYGLGEVILFLVVPWASAAAVFG